MGSDKYGVQSLGAGWSSQLAPDGSTVYYDNLGNFNVAQVGGTSMGSYDGNNFVSMNGIDYTAADAATTGSGMDWLNNNAKGIGAGLGLAQLGLGAYSTFFGQGKDRFDKQMKLLDQQIASNTDKLQRRDALNKAWAQYGQGLAGSTAKGQ